MAESWSTSRQCIISGSEALVFGTDRDSFIVSAKRINLTINCVTSCKLAWGEGRKCVIYGHDPDYSDVKITMSATLKKEDTRNCVLVTDPVLYHDPTTGNPWTAGSIVTCQYTAVSADGAPKVLEYPKYYNDATVPPDFDVVFKIHSGAPIDWSSFTVQITSSSGSSKSYGKNQANIIEITPEIIEIRIVPSDLLVLLGDTVNVKAYLKDIYGRELRLNW